MDMILSKFWETVEDREARGVTVCGVTKSQTWLQREGEGETYYMELAHVVVQAEKSHDLQWQAGDPGEAMLGRYSRYRTQV